MMIIAVGAGEQIARVLPELGRLLRRPLVTLERVRVCKRDGQRLAEPQRLPGADEHGLRLWQKLMVYTSEAATFEGRAMHEAIVERLRETGASGATTLRGVWGFHGDHAPHGDRLFQVRRNVPVVTIVVDDPDRIARSFEIVDEITRQRGLVTSEMVPALAASHEGGRRGELRLARHRF
jgi:PII-like signaling protein